MVDACAEAAEGPNAATIHHLYPDMARLVAITGRSDIADKVAPAAEELESRYSTHSRHGTAALCRGMAENRPALLREAARSFREAGRPWYEGQAHENLAALLAMSGHLDEARAALGNAIERYTGLGAEWDTHESKRAYGSTGFAEDGEDLAIAPSPAWRRSHRPNAKSPTW
ncbi:hypothetical protein [Nocardia sp. NPDC004604]|uniref:hypothetical protein n=1 Tax=Nocardia sp. NPDC004604 TaxID=3157013 RepID=UPI0033BC7882